MGELKKREEADRNEKSETKDGIKCSGTQNEDRMRGRKGDRRVNKGSKVPRFNLLPMLRSGFSKEREEV